MANVVTLQTILDGPRNAIIKVTGVLDTSNVAAQQVVIPANLMHDSQMNAPTLVRLNHIDYSITDQLEVITSWGLAAGAGPGAALLPLAGRGRMSFDDFKGITNNQSPTDGSIWLSTNGWTSGTQIFSVIFELQKAGLVGVGVR